ncbi:MAG: cytochrome c3 family protein, partial [Phycisphaerae bacterium]
MKRLLSLWIGVTLVLAGIGSGSVSRGQANSDSIVGTLHNLSASGPGTVKASSEAEICIFCHTPHNATAIQPLWNRALPVSAYKPYTSNSLKAKPGQPTGSSKLCLSCHDGTIALGNVHSRNQPIVMSGGVTVLPQGRTNLGTDLSDDHPISFKYDTLLTSRNAKLKDPSLLPAEMRLDSNSELQCMTCHDAHKNSYGNFLVLANTGGALCNKCHQMGSTDITAHVVCDSCHKTHTAPSGPYLLAKAKVSDTCLQCHSGAIGANQGPNIAQVLAKVDPHDTQSPVNLVNHIPNNVDCKDCHEQHSIQTSAIGTAPGIKPLMGKIDGIAAVGGPVVQAQYEYQVCFKCHADSSAVNPTRSRQIVQSNLRLKLDSSAISFHPVEIKGKNTNVPSLRPGYTTDSIIYCTDCHGSETSKKAGGSGANGPHGSSYRPLLITQ